MSFAEINGQRIRFDDTGGEGPAVILAHGFLMDRTMFAPQVAALAGEFRVITWDERGFGETEYDGQPFSYWDSARDCLGLMNHLGIERAVVGGMSQGGFVSLRAALLEPERVRALVLIDTQAGVEDPVRLPAYRQMQQTWLEAGPVDELTDAIANLILGTPELNSVWVEKWRGLDRERSMKEPGDCLLDRDDITERLVEISCPAIVFHGTADVSIDMGRAEQLCDGLADARPLVRVEGAPHAANLTHPEQVNPPLLDFLRSL
ncbi:MAG TPA: alpha/beta hydrolase [Solirubrobacteraceae bacterium]|jgi:3-oxoadipate enol-lactonase|nr:alpha/beta hydrolase [Solirubrobacteraceae bacterium]